MFLVTVAFVSVRRRDRQCRFRGVLRGPGRKCHVHTQRQQLQLPRIQLQRRGTILSIHNYSNPCAHRPTIEFSSAVETCFLQVTTAALQICFIDGDCTVCMVLCFNSLAGLLMITLTRPTVQNRAFQVTNRRVTSNCS